MSDLPIKPIKSTIKAAGEAKISEIFVPERLRKDTPEVRKWIDENLMPSIADLGLIQPITVTNAQPDSQPFKDGFKYILVAGWSRLQSFIGLQFAKIPFSLAKDLPEHKRKAMEISENTTRRAMDWQDVVMGIFSTHNDMVANSIESGDTWSQLETGKLLRVARQKVNKALLIASALIAKDKEICDAPNFESAMKILLERKGTEASRRLAAITGGSVLTPNAPQVGPVSFIKGKPTMGPIATLDEDDIFLQKRPGTSPAPIPAINPLAVQTGHRPVKTAESSGKPQDTLIRMSDYIHKADFRDYCKTCPAETFDGVLTDIPYGLNPVDLEDLSGFKYIEKSHQQQENVDLMPYFFGAMWRVLKPDTFLFFYYDILWQETLVKHAEASGFVVQPFPLVWLKPTCKNNSPQAQWPKTMEYVMVCRKGQPKLLRPQITNYMLCDNLTERKQQKNPFAKPFKMTEMIAKAAWHPGAHILDCFAGGGSIGRHLLSLGHRPTLIEKDEDGTQIEDLIKNIQDELIQIFHGRVKFE